MQQTIDRLRERESTYRILLDESSDPIFAFEPDGTYRYVNQAFAEGVNRRLEEIIGRKIWDVFPQDEADKRYALVSWVFAHGEKRDIEVRVPRLDGDRYYLTTAKPIINEQGEVTSVICISKEITERKRMEEELRQMSSYDLLTNLYNRNYCETEVRSGRANRALPMCIVRVDVDYLKKTNDTQGHAAGDALIRRAARVLSESFRTEDIIARYGGDEFIVLLRGTAEQDILVILDRLRANIARENDPGFSMSIGYACGGEETTMEELIKQADDRMYTDKAGRAGQRRGALLNK